MTFNSASLHDYVTCLRYYCALLLGCVLYWSQYRISFLLCNSNCMQASVRHVPAWVLHSAATFLYLGPSLRRKLVIVCVGLHRQPQGWCSLQRSCSKYSGASLLFVLSSIKLVWLNNWSSCPTFKPLSLTLFKLHHYQWKPWKGPFLLVLWSSIWTIQEASPSLAQWRYVIVFYQGCHTSTAILILLHTFPLYN